MAVLVGSVLATWDRVSYGVLCYGKSVMAGHGEFRHGGSWRVQVSPAMASYGSHGAVMRVYAGPGMFCSGQESFGSYGYADLGMFGRCSFR